MDGGLTEKGLPAPLRVVGASSIRLGAVLAQVALERAARQDASTAMRPAVVSLSRSAQASRLGDCDLCGASAGGHDSLLVAVAAADPTLAVK
jgi:hypothetical protein